MTFARLNFNTPIHYETRPACFSLSNLREIADNYCDWGSETAYVPSGFTNCVELRRNSASQNCLYWIKCAFKVASYFTLIIPALMYLAKYLLRASPFYVVSQVQPEIDHCASHSHKTQNELAHPEAAIRIQQAFRRYRTRKARKHLQGPTVIQTTCHAHSQKVVSNLPLQNVAAIQLQKTCRGYLSRKVYQQQQAIVAIQNFWRGHLARVKVEETRDHVLPGKLFDAALPYLEGWQHVEREFFISGRAFIYFVPEVPVVLKRSDSGQKRMDEMAQCRAICRKNEFKHIVIPKVCWYDPYWLVESRIPFSGRTKESICLYILHTDAFTEVAKEFTRLLCQSYLEDSTDAVSNHYCDYRHFTAADIPIPRYDNVAFFLENGQGKVGLVDLEKFQPKSGSLQNSFNAIYFFPLHIQEIYTVAEQFYPNIKEYKDKLFKMAQQQAAGFKNICEFHLEFLKKKNITIENGATITPFSQVAKTAFSEKITEFLLDLHEKQWIDDNLLGEQPEQTAVAFSKEFAKNILEAVHQILQWEIARHCKGQITTLPQLLDARTLLFKWAEWSLSDEFPDLLRRLTTFVSIPSLKKRSNATSLFHYLAEMICQTWAAQGEFAYYKEGFGHYRCTLIIF